jgi:hypothetical protein
VAVEPTLPQAFSFSNFQIIFIMTLHNGNHLGNFRKSHMQQFLHVPKFDFNDVLCVLGKRCTAYLLCADYLNYYLFTSIICYLFQGLVQLLSFVDIDLLRTH